MKRAKVCCCPKPLPWSKTCKGNKFIYKKKYFKLVHGKCLKRIKIRKENIDCRAGSIKKIRNFKCNRNTCLKKSVIYRITQHGCKCGLKTSRTYKKCCCPPPVHQMVCKGDRKWVKLSKTWHIRNNRCVMHKESYVKEKVDHCRNKKFIGRCNKKSKFRLIKFIIYKPKHCKCVPVKGIVKKLLCSCPKPVKRMKKCNKHSCLKSSVVIYFIGPLKNKKCVRKVKKFTWKCCCPGKQKWSTKKCDKSSGNKEFLYFHKHFDHKSKTCKIKRRRKVIETRCPSKSVKGKEANCDRATGLKTVYVFQWKKDHRHCLCKKMKLKKHVRCGCKHKKCQLKPPKCVRGKFVKREKVCFTWSKSKCKPVVKIHLKKIACRHKRHVQRMCNRKACVGKKEIATFIIKNCKCIRRVKVKKYTCCCPKSSRTLKCQNDSWEITKVGYLFQKESRHCKRVIVKKSQIIKCRSRRITATRCNRATCTQTRDFQHFKVINCLCKMVKVQKIIRKCCCPKKKNRIKCYHNYGVMQHVQYQYRLYKGTCVVQKLVEQDKISCRRTKFIRSKCDRNTKKLTVKIISYKRVGCKCRKSIRTVQTLCACKKPTFSIGKCKNKLKSMFLVEYVLKKSKHSSKCVKIVTKLHTDQCACPKSLRTRKCKDNQIEIRKVEYTLRERKKRKFCHMKEVVRHESIKCPPKRQYKTECKNFKYQIVTVFYQLKSCRCLKKRTIKVQACGCPKRNKHYSYCSDGVIFNVDKTYYSTKGITHCLMHLIQRSKSINCKKHKRKTPITSRCIIKRNYGYFKEYLISWYKQIGCKCVQKTRKITKLCKCLPNIKKVKCIADDTLKTYQMTVNRVGKRCLPKQETTTRDIQCTGNERDVKYFPCMRQGRHKCFQEIQVLEKWVENCKCRTKLIRIRRRCCVPNAIKEKFCDKKRGENVHRTTIFKLTLGKILYRKDDFMIQDKTVIKSIINQKQEIICPSRSIVENCDKKSGDWVRKIITYRRIGCHCKKYIKKINGKCHCPASREISSKCINEFQTIRSIMYQLIDRHCVRFSQVSKQRCSCPEKVHRIYCDGEGRWVKCLTEFNLNSMSHTCSLEKRCVRWDQVCPEPYRVNGKCNKATHKRRSTDVMFHLNEDKCKCEKSKEHSFEFCGCDHLNRVSEKCINGVQVTLKTLYTLNKGQCLPTRIKIKKKIDCPRTITHFKKCNRNRHLNRFGYRQVKIVTFHNKNCKCVKRMHISYEPCDCKLLHKSRKNTFCKNHDIKMSKLSYYVLDGKKCIRRTKFFKSDIVCSTKTKTKRGRCRLSKSSKISYKTYKVFRQVSRNCKCVWKLKSIIKSICRCPSTKRLKKCLKDKIMLNIETVFTKNKSGKKCFKRNLIRKTRIYCSKTWTRSHCQKESCSLFTSHFSQKPSNCKCVTVRKIARSKCCCAKPTKRRTICNAKKHTLTTSWFTFKLIHEKCIRKKRFSSFKVRCERRKPKVMMGKCVKHHRAVYIIMKKNHKCQCVNFTKTIRERCKCPKKVKYHKGKCIGNFAEDQWSALKFLSKSKKCVRQIIQIRNRRCKCPAKRSEVKCVNSDTKIHTEIKFFLQSKTNSCKKVVSKIKHHIGCTKTPILVKKGHSRCSKRTGYYKTVKKTYKVAKGCKCVFFTRKSSWPCNCQKLYPTVKTVKCIRDKYQMVVVNRSYRKQKKCFSKLTKRTRLIRCFGEKKKVGTCRHKTQHKSISIYRKRVSKCRCHWMLVKRFNVLCRCPRSTTKVQCIKGKYLMKRKTQFLLRKGKCVAKHSQINFSVKCDTGVKIKISKCDAFSGYKTIWKTIKSINKCQCFVHSSRKKCRCQCPRPLKYTICIGRTGHFKTTKVVHKLDQCKCISKRSVSKIKIKCPKSKTIVTLCNIVSQDGDKYKLIIHVSHYRDGCKCTKTVKKKKVLCACFASVKKFRTCVNNKYKVVTVTRRVKTHGQCKRVIVDKDKLEIECPDNKQEKRCNQKTGIETIMILRWLRKECKCFSRKIVKTRKCKCRSHHQLVHFLKCNHKCQEVKVYKFELMDSHHNCKTKYIAKRRMCCCSKLVKTSSKCRPKFGMVETKKKFFKLVGGKCVSEYSEKKHMIRCPKKTSKSIKKLPKGVVKIIISKTKRVGCKCKVHRKILLRTWHCPKSKKSTKCVDAPESSKETVTISYRMMTKTAGCKKLVFVHREPTECEPDRTYWTKCQKGKHGSYKSLIQISYSAKNCKCHKSIEKTPTLCSCAKPKLKKFCDKSKGLRVQTITHFVPDPAAHKHCIPVVSRQHFKVLCDNMFKFSHKTKCSSKTFLFHIVSKAERKVGCRCQTIWRKKSCKCKCPKTKIFKKCRRDNVNEKIITNWILLKCHCKKLVNSHLETIKCPEKTKSYMKCGADNKCIRKIIITFYKSHNCQCQKSLRILSSKCCCPKPTKTKQCIRGNWVTRSVFYKLKMGRCFKTSRQKIRKILCKGERIVQMIGPCLSSKKQKYRLTKFEKKGCKCVKVSRTFFRHCICLNKSAAEVVFLVDQTVSSRREGFQPLIKKILRDTVRVFPVGKSHYRFALVKYSEKPTVVFHLNDHHQHSSIFSYINKLPYSGRFSNLAKALYLTRTQVLRRSRSGILQIVYIISDGVNDKNFKKALHEIISLRKMHVRINVVAIKPSVKGLRFLKGLVMHGPHNKLWKIVKKKHLQSLPPKILRSICKKACPITKIKRSHCSKETGCKGKTFVYGYRKVGKQCVRKITTHLWFCCCLSKPKSFKLCLKNSRLLLVTIDWKFAHRTCLKQITRKDVSGRLLRNCKPTIQRRLGHCQSSSNVRTIVFIKQSIKHCKCVKSVTKKSEICRCSRSRRFKTCHAERFVVNIKMYETLSKDRCIKRRKMSKTPIVCAKSKMITSRCNSITCEKKIKVVRFFVKNCQCHHKTETRLETCCCSRSKQVRKMCKRNNQKVFEKSFLSFDRRRRTCVKKTVRKAHKIMCKSKPEVHFSKCDRPMSKLLWYKIKQTKSFYVKNCQCLSVRRQELIPCRCSKGPVVRRCVRNNTWQKFAVIYVLEKKRRGKKVIGKCKKHVKTLSLERHECSKKYHRKYGKCSGHHSSLQKYRFITLSWSVVKNCKCVQMAKRVKELCKCPNGDSKKICVKNKYLVTFRTWFQISGRKTKAKCVRKTKKFFKKIACPAPRVTHSPCKKKYDQFQVITTKLSVPRKCHCLEKTYVRKVLCRHPITGNKVPAVEHCLDMLPIKVCAKVKRIGGCTKHGGIYREKLCRATCNRCSICAKGTHSKIGFQIKYHSCLVTDHKYKGKLHLRSFSHTSYRSCLLKCKAMQACKSFDYYIVKKKNQHQRTGELGHCVLNKVVPEQLESKIYPHPLELGASYEDLKRHGASHCMLNVKICKSICPEPVVKKLGKCKCTTIKGRKHCHRKSMIFYHIIGGHGERRICLRRSWKGLVPCHTDGCNNWKSDKKCKRLKMQGKCSNSIVKKICKKTCINCKCASLRTYKTKCDKAHHKFKIVIATFVHRHHRKCVMKITQEKMSCNVCYKKPFKVIHKCKNSVRYISTIFSVKMKDGSCKTLSSNKVFSCSKCPKNDQYFVTSCSKASFLRLVTKYSVREKGCCRFKLESRKFRCHKCPQRKVRRTRCSAGYRLRHVYYYVRPMQHSTKVKNVHCRQRVYTKKEKCISHGVCQDEMSEHDCKSFKYSDGCRRKEADAYKLCRASCGLC